MKNKLLLSIFVLFLAGSMAGTCWYAHGQLAGIPDNVTAFYHDAETQGANYEVPLLSTYTFKSSNPMTFFEFDNAPIVLRGKHNGVRHHYCNAAVQEVTVEKVLKGAPETLVGQTVRVISGFCFDRDFKMAGQGYTNLMKEGHSYLIFLFPFGMTANDPNGFAAGNLYTIYTFSNFGYLDYQPQKDRTADSLPQKSATAGNKKKRKKPTYAEMRENEFFAENQKALQMMYKKKAEIFEQYGEQMEVEA